MTDAELGERTKREREAWNAGLRRSLYDRIFRHCGSQYDQHRRRILRDALRAAENAEVLELGSQMWHGWLEEGGVTPKRLVCVNLSDHELEKGKRRAGTARLSPEFHQMDAHDLAFEDHSFDVVYGGGILHHLDLTVALAEIARVLRPEGVIVFHEPLDFNPVGRIVRWLTPAARTPDERPFRKWDIARIQELFACQFHFEQFLSVPIGVLSGIICREADNRLTRLAFHLDQRLLQLLPSLGFHYRHTLFVGRRRLGTP